MHNSSSSANSRFSRSLRATSFLLRDFAEDAMVSTIRRLLVYLPRRGQRSGSKNSRRWRSPSRTSSGSLTPLTLYVATARSKCTNTRATTVVPNGKSNALQ
ncbi:conserved hypothetical protein [Trichinella spiralis]|uniref:hypothetical protein n=1 Tax=Trichinella spiralis TaxID=6334 RepID=UPI0001EFE625|nr:conserved hypothetical protein [Trichinella spiralis]